MRFYDGSKFKKLRPRPCSPATFSIDILKIFRNSNCCINLLFDARSLPLGRFGIFDVLFPFLAFLSYSP